VKGFLHMEHMEYSEDELLAVGIAHLLKMILFVLVLLTVISVFIICLGWFLSLAFSQFTLFQATLIPLSILGFASLLLGLISIWIRLGDVVMAIENSMFLNDDEFDEDEELFWEKDSFVKKKATEHFPAKITPIHNNDNNKKKPKSKKKSDNNKIH